MISASALTNASSAMSFTSLREVVAAALVRRVPADAVLRAVDRGLEPEAEALAAERIGRRRGRDRRR